MRRIHPILTLVLSIPAAGCAAGAKDIATETFPTEQAEVKHRLAEIWSCAATKDVARLRSYHLYGTKYTEFKDGPRGDAAAGEAGERAFLAVASDAKVDMRDLKVDVFGDVAIATFNGDFSAKVDGHPMDVQQGATMAFVKQNGEWKIVHEHFSTLMPK